MSRWLPERAGRAARLFIGLDQEALAWCDGVRGEAFQAPLSPADPLPPLYATVRHVDVIAGPRVAVHWLLQPPPALASLDELRRCAQAQCAQRFGGTPDDWAVAAQWQARQAFVCVGLPRQAMHALQQRVRAPQARWRWHTPWSLLARHHGVRKHRAAASWWALRSPTRLLLWLRHGSATLALLVVPLPGSASHEHAQVLAQQHSERWHVVHGGTAHGGVRWVDPLTAAGEPCTEALYALAQRRALA